MKKHEKRGLEASKIHQKSTRMVPRSAPKGVLEEGWETCERQWFNVEAFWRHLGDFGRFLGALKIQGVPKTVPKIEYGDFLAPKGGWEALKSCSRRGSENQLKFWSDFDWKKEAQEG